MNIAQLQWAPYPIASQLVRPKSAVKKIVLLGDSITQGSNSIDANGIPTYHDNSICPFTMPIMSSGGKYILLRNSGIAGQTSAQILARVGTDVLAYQPDVCIVCVGTNDTLPGINNDAYASMMNNIKQIVLMLMASNILPVLVVPPPKTANPTEPKRARYFYYKLAEKYGLPLIDLYKLYVDPSNGQYLAGYSGDGVHPNTTATIASSSVISAIMNNLHNPDVYPYMGVVAESTAGEPSNLVRNGNFNISTTPPTPDMWSPNASNATFALNAASYPFNGKDFVYTSTGTNGRYALSGFGIAAGYANVGDILSVYLSMRITGISAPVEAFDLTMGTSNGSAIYKCFFNANNHIAIKFPYPTGGGITYPQCWVQNIAACTFNNFTVVNETQLAAIWSP